MRRNQLANAVATALDGPFVPWWPQILPANDGLLYPYYTALDIGSEPSTAVVRLIGGRCFEVLDFNLFLSSRDVWSQP